MNPERLKETAAQHEQLATHREYLDAIIRPSVDITIVEAAPEPHHSRFGGHPLAGRDFVWPKHDMGEYKFLGQVNFSEISNRPSLLPDEGLLSLFYAFDEDGEIFWGDDGYVLGYYWPDLAKLKIKPSPSAPPEPKKIELKGGVEIPRHKDLRKDWPFHPKLLNELLSGEELPENYLLGYPSFNSLGYDPTPGPGWFSLLTLNSEDDFDWCWHDGGKLMVFVESDKLKKKDFSELKSDAG